MYYNKRKRNIYLNLEIYSVQTFGIKYILEIPYINLSIEKKLYEKR